MILLTLDMPASPDELAEFARVAAAVGATTVLTAYNQLTARIDPTTRSDTPPAAEPQPQGEPHVEDRLVGYDEMAEEEDAEQLAATIEVLAGTDDDPLAPADDEPEPAGPAGTTDESHGPAVTGADSPTEEDDEDLEPAGDLAPAGDPGISRGDSHFGARPGCAREILLFLADLDGGTWEGSSSDLARDVWPRAPRNALGELVKLEKAGLVEMTRGNGPRVRSVVITPAGYLRIDRTPPAVQPASPAPEPRVRPCTNTNPHGAHTYDIHGGGLITSHACPGIDAPATAVPAGQPDSQPGAPAEATAPQAPAIDAGPIGHQAFDPDAARARAAWAL